MTGPRRKPMMWGPIPPVPKPSKFPTPDDSEDDQEMEEIASSIDVQTAPADQNDGVLTNDDQDKAEKAADTDQETEEERAYTVPGPYPPPPMTPTGPPYQGYELARAYVPIQMFGPTYNPAEALEKGTLFPELWRPYPGR